MALVGKPGTEDIYEIPDTEVEKARGKGYKQYFDVTKDDKNTFTIAEDELEKAKAKGYRIFGQTQPAATKPAEEPGVLEQAGDWAKRAGTAAVETVKGIPSGLYELGKEVITQPQKAIPAAITGAAKTLGAGQVAGALRGGYEASKAALTGEEIQPAFKRGYETEVSELEERAKQAKKVSPAAYAAGPYAATAAATGGLGLPATIAAETATGAAQQYAETGKIDTAELAGQTLAGLGLTKGVQKAGQLVERVSPVKVTQTGREAAVGRLEEAAVKKAEEVGGIGDVAKEYIGEEGAAKIRETKRAGYDVGQAKSQYKVLKSQLDNEFNSKVYNIDQKNSKLDADYTAERAKRAAEYNDLISKVDQERQRIGKGNEDVLADYNAKLESHNQETARLEQQYQDAKQKYAIEKADYTRQTQEKAKQLDQEYLGKKEAYETEELPKWQETRQQELAANEKAKQDYRMQITEWQANTKKAVNDLKLESNQAFKQAIQKAKEAKRTMRGEAITAMGDELRGMLDNMDKIQQEAYSARKMMADADMNLVENVGEASTTKAIADVEQILNSGYMLDDSIKADLKNIKSKVDPGIQKTNVTRGADFETLHELRIYLDNLKSNIDKESLRIRREGGAEPKDLTQKRNAIYNARKKVQDRLYGQDSVFSPELRDLGEAADGIYSEFSTAKKLMEQKDLLAREKAVPGLKRGIEPRSALIESYFNELDAGRKAQMKSIMSDFGVDTSRLDLLEEQVRRGVVPEPIAIRQLELPERPTFTYQPQFTPKPTRPSRPLASEYMVETQPPIAPIKPAFPVKPTKPTLQPLPQRPVFEAPVKPVYEATPRKRIMGPEEMGLKGTIAEKEALAQEYKALGGKTAFDSQGLADIADKRGLISRGLEYVGEKAGIGLTPMQLLERAAEVRGSRSLVEKVQAAFPDNPTVNTVIKSIVNTGTKITPALVRAVARRSNVDEEKLAKAIVESQTP